MKEYAKFFGALGFVLFLFGLICTVLLQGWLQKIALLELALGLSGCMIFLFYFLGETLRTLSQRKDAIYGSVGILFILALLIGVNVIAHSRWGEKKFDTTANKIYSLSNESVNLIKNLGTDIKVISFFSKAAQQRAVLEDLVGKYTYQSSKIKYEAIDPDLDPARVKALGAAQDEVLILNETTKKSMKLTNMTEEALTSAIKRVMSSTAKSIYFLQGHGESDLDDDKTAQGFYIAKVLLENEGFSVKTLNLSRTEIPADAHIVASWGAQRAFSKTEIDALLKYLERGGNLVLAVDPILSPTKDKLISLNLEPITDRVGIEIKPSILLEYQIQLLRGQVINSRIPISSFGNHSIVSSFGSQAALEVFLALPILQKGDFKDSQVTRTALASSSEQAWAETDMASIFVAQKPTPTNDARGPLPIAQLAELKISDQIKDAISKTGKLIVFGDSDFGQNQMIQSGYNRDFLLNSFNYLGGEELGLTIRPKTWNSSTLQISEENRRLVDFASIFGIPQFIMILGVVIWLMRRTRA